MLTIKCSACGHMLWKYEKFGMCEVLRCYKSRIVRAYEYKQMGDKIICSCGNEVGIDKGSYIKMNKKGFVYTGTKKH